MPGIHLSNTEKKLKKLWDSNTSIPFLTSISIDDGTPIRGMKNCKIDFQYPITVFCGKNGSGKTTFLQLAALAFHHKETQYRKTFSDFLKKTKYDSSNDGTKLTWYYTGTDAKGRALQPISVHKGHQKWMHYDRRPNKKVIVLPVSRTLPANEKRYNYADGLQDNDFTKLNPQYLKYLQKIMGRKYSDVSSYNDVFSKCVQNKNCEYSCYNMGIGEKIICYILSVLQDADPLSLIIIDELEMGLHPEALSLLAEVMQEIVLEKKLQIFITSHSRDFLDALPREARIVVQRTGETTTFINSPTMVYAISQISRQKMDELVIICEDAVAKTIIEKSLIGLQKRVSCIDMGSKSEILKAANYNKQIGDKRKHLVIWDGDVSDAEIEGYYGSLKISSADIPFIRLPGNGKLAPEKWLLQVLDNDDGYAKIEELLNIDNSCAKDCIQRANIVIDCHDIFYEIAKECGLDDKDIMSGLCQAACSLRRDELQNIKNKVEYILNN